MFYCFHDLTLCHFLLLSQLRWQLMLWEKNSVRYRYGKSTANSCHLHILMKQRERGRLDGWSTNQGWENRITQRLRIMQKLQVMKWDQLMSRYWNEVWTITRNAYFWRQSISQNKRQCEWTHRTPTCIFTVNCIIRDTKRRKLNHYR